MPVPHWPKYLNYVPAAEKKYHETISSPENIFELLNSMRMMVFFNVLIIAKLPIPSAISKFDCSDIFIILNSNDMGFVIYFFS